MAEGLKAATVARDVGRQRCGIDCEGMWEVATAGRSGRRRWDGGSERKAFS